MFFNVLLAVCVVVYFSVTFIDLFSCIAASLFNKLTYFLTCKHFSFRYLYADP